MSDSEFTPEELETEEWRDVVGWEGIYSVSDFLRVRRDRAGKGTYAGRILKTPPDSHGYPQVHLCDRSTGRGETSYVHIISTRTFWGPPPEGMEVNHKLGTKIKTNARLSDLEYVTHAENAAHAVKHGLMANGDRNGSRTCPERRPRGKDHGSSKLTEEDVRGIRAATGLQRDIAEQFGTSKENVSHIKRGDTWKHLL